jgi:hypothetical protein
MENLADRLDMQHYSDADTRECRRVAQGERFPAVRGRGQ